MRTVGIIATSAGGLVAAVALLVGVRSVPDIRRYLKMRGM